MLANTSSKPTAPATDTAIHRFMIFSWRELPAALSGPFKQVLESGLHKRPLRGGDSGLGDGTGDRGLDPRGIDGHLRCNSVDRRWLFLRQACHLVEDFLRKLWF